MKWGVFVVPREHSKEYKYRYFLYKKNYIDYYACSDDKFELMSFVRKHKNKGLQYPGKRKS